MWEISSKFLKTEILDQNSLVAEGYDYERTQLEATPVYTLTPSVNESDYVTTTENRRVYAFMLRLFVERQSGSDEEKTAEDAMRELVDSVLDDLDKNHRLSGMDTKTGYQYLYMEAAPSVWGYAGRESEYRVAEIIIRLHFDIDVNVVT